MIRQFKIGQTFYEVLGDSTYHHPMTITTITITKDDTRYLFSSKYDFSESELNAAIDSDRMFLNEIDAIRKNILNLENELKQFSKGIRSSILDKKKLIKNLTSKK